MEDKALEAPWTEEEVLKAIRSFPGHSATGMDQWRVRDFARLPGPGRVELTSMLNTIEEKQSMPA
eukprot:604573-Pyramimonas_sp.AAC.1